jgi:hypothetical protein
MGAPQTNMGSGGGGRGGGGGGGGPSLKLDHRGANISLPMHIIGSLLGGMKGPAPQMAGRLGASQIGQGAPSMGQGAPSMGQGAPGMGQGAPGMGGQGFQGLTPQMMQAALIRPPPRFRGSMVGTRPTPIPNMRELPMSPTSHMPKQAGGGQGMQQLMAMAAQGRRPMRGVRYGSHVYLGGDPASEESWHEVA